MSNESAVELMAGFIAVTIAATSIWRVQITGVRYSQLFSAPLHTTACPRLSSDPLPEKYYQIRKTHIIYGMHTAGTACKYIL